MINSIFLPCLVPGACAILGRGPGIAVPPGAAGGSQSIHNHCSASFGIRDRGCSQLISQRSIQIELIFRLLLKITVDGPPECDLINFCPPRGGKTNKRSNSNQYRIYSHTRERCVWCRSRQARFRSRQGGPEAFGSPSNMKFHDLTVAQLVERGTVIALQRISLGRWFESVR